MTWGLGLALCRRRAAPRLSRRARRGRTGTRAASMPRRTSKWTCRSRTSSRNQLTSSSARRVRRQSRSAAPGRSFEDPSG
eukprot:scaffold35003_cov91-Phaeocystis_antarctica.AAC.2